MCYVFAEYSAGTAVMLRRHRAGSPRRLFKKILRRQVRVGVFFLHFFRMPYFHHSYGPFR